MSNHIPLVLKFENWPQADRSAWEGLFTEGGFLGDVGPCQKWSQGSRTKRRQGWGQWLSFLKRHDEEALRLSPRVRVSEARVRLYVDECQTRLAPQSTANLISDLYVVASNFAPDLDWHWLNSASKRLTRAAMKRSLPAPHQITVSEVLHRCISQMERVEANPNLTPLKRAIHYRQALMIAFLISRPIRRRALLAMTVGAHVMKQSDGFHLYFAETDMKDKRARDFPLPKVLNEPMLAYLNTYRPILLHGQRSDGLWINQYGDPITPDGYSRELPKITKRLLGIELRPHAFRDIAATFIAETDPEHINIIRDILGHATLNMAERYYNRATGITACNALQALGASIRKDARQMHVTAPHSQNSSK